MAAHEAAFAEALLDPARPIPPGIVAPTQAAPQRRFAVYRNNVTVSLVEALRARFPALERIVGEEFFRAMARVFVAEHPPKSPLLMQFGDELACFLDHFAPAADLPYLGDVARLEAARTRAYHAADAAPADPAGLAAVPLKRLNELRITLHPSVQIVRSMHPIVTIWAMNAGDAAPAPIADWTPQDALVARPHLDVVVRALPPGAAAFLLALAAGAPLAQAAEAALADDENFNLTNNLVDIFSAGIAAGFGLTDGDSAWQAPPARR